MNRYGILRVKPSEIKMSLLDGTPCFTRDATKKVFLSNFVYTPQPTNGTLMVLKSRYMIQTKRKWISPLKFADLLRAHKRTHERNTKNSRKSA